MYYKEVAFKSISKWESVRKAMWCVEEMGLLKQFVALEYFLMHTGVSIEYGHH